MHTHMADAGYFTRHIRMATCLRHGSSALEKKKERQRRLLSLSLFIIIFIPKLMTTATSNYYSLPSPSQTSALSTYNNSILLAGKSSLSLYELPTNDGRLYPIKKLNLNHYQPITTAAFYRNEDSIITGHENGTVLIVHQSDIVSKLSIGTLPVSHIQPYLTRDLISITGNKKLSIHHGNKHVFQMKYNELYSVAVNTHNSKILALATGNDGISLLDLRNRATPYVYSPNSSSSFDCVDTIWLDEFHLASTHSDTIKIWDIRSNDKNAICDLLPGKSTVNSLQYSGNLLFSKDIANNIVSWDLSKFKAISIGTTDENFVPTVLSNEDTTVGQCGNVILPASEGSVLMNLIDNKTLLTYNQMELGSHKFCRNDITTDWECSSNATSVEEHQEEKHSNSLYSLNKLTLSGATVYSHGL